MTISAYPYTNWQDIIEANRPDTGNGVGLRNRDLLKPADRFVKRHIGPRSQDVTNMLDILGLRIDRRSHPYGYSLEKAAQPGTTTKRIGRSGRPAPVGYAKQSLPILHWPGLL